MDTSAKEFQTWWEKLTTQAKKAIVRRQERRAEKKANRAALRAAGTSGYCCPKCFTWHGTPWARAACRLSHSAEVEQETDGRFIAEIHQLPGVLAYGATRGEAVAAARGLAERVLRERSAGLAG